MNFLQKLLKKGFFFTITRPWRGEEKLPPAKVFYHSPTKEEVEQEIRDSLNKKEATNGTRKLDQKTV